MYLQQFRTSVDHGTAFDIVGKNLAVGSLKEAIKIANDSVKIKSNLGRLYRVTMIIRDKF